MEKLKNAEELVLAENRDRLLQAKVQRRSFLKYAGAGLAGIAVVAVGCDKGDNPDVISLGEDDTRILNYAYALEQLEAAFYIKVIDSTSNGLSADEVALFTSIRDHEIAHREFFKNALGKMAIKSLDVDFSSINFSSRDSIIDTAKAFEDLGVSAYNGAGRLIKNPDYLLLAGKIVSVEARHAALIRDLKSNGTFADSTIINAQGLDTSMSPEQVLAIAQKYLKTEIRF